MKSQVALVRCNDYDEANVEQAVQRGIELLGGMAKFIRPDEKILLKPNILAGDDPEKLVGPHPLVFKAAARLAQQVTRTSPTATRPALENPSLRRVKLDCTPSLKRWAFPWPILKTGARWSSKNHPSLNISPLPTVCWMRMD